jgi:hypothetical protein
MECFISGLRKASLGREKWSEEEYGREEIRYWENRERIRWAKSSSEIQTEVGR